MEDLYALRGSVGHGFSEAASKSIWSAKEHLLLAAHIFPLLVKLTLHQAGKWRLSSDDKLALELFDLFLASENLLACDPAKGNVPSAYEWHRIWHAGDRAFIERW